MYEANSSGNYVLNGETKLVTNNIKSNGLYERTGAGILDIDSFLNFNCDQIKETMNFSDKNLIELKKIYLADSQKVKISLVWTRNSTVTISKFLWWETSRTYTLNELPDFDLYLYNSNGVIVGSSASSNSNVENIYYTSKKSDYYTIKLRPYNNYEDIHKINFSYIIK